MAPIALSIAGDLGASPHNTPALGPAQYRFGDFVKLGVAVHPADRHAGP